MELYVAIASILHGADLVLVVGYSNNWSIFCFLFYWIARASNVIIIGIFWLERNDFLGCGKLGKFLRLIMPIRGSESIISLTFYIRKMHFPSWTPILPRAGISRYRSPVWGPCWAWGPSGRPCRPGPRRRWDDGGALPPPCRPGSPRSPSCVSGGGGEDWRHDESEINSYQ